MLGKCIIKVLVGLICNSFQDSSSDSDADYQRHKPEEHNINDVEIESIGSPCAYIDSINSEVEVFYKQVRTNNIYIYIYLHRHYFNLQLYVSYIYIYI